MVKTEFITLLCVLLLLSGASSYTGHETNITHVGIYGQSVVLPCGFLVGSSFHLDTTEIIWKHNQEVTHIFYGGRDQPQHQSHHYTNRTSLYHEEIKNGNASLRLENATLRDEGEYTCTVRMWDEYHIKTLKLNITENGGIDRNNPEGVNTAVPLAFFILVVLLLPVIVLAFVSFIGRQRQRNLSSENPNPEEHQNSLKVSIEETETCKELLKDTVECVKEKCVKDIT